MVLLFLKDLLPDFMFWNRKECAVLSQMTFFYHKHCAIATNIYEKDRLETMKIIFQFTTIFK